LTTQLRGSPVDLEHPSFQKLRVYRRSIELDGIVEAVLPNTTFRVHLPNGHTVLATIAGKMRRFRIRVLAGDRVTLAVSPYDLTRGRITFRHK